MKGGIMKQIKVMAGIAGIGLLSASVTPTLAERQAVGAAFDPLYVSGATCVPKQGGRPPLLEQLVLAQAETKPFKPGQQLPQPASAGPAPLYTDLGKLHVPITTASPKAQAFFDQGMRLTFGFNHAEAARAFRAAQQLDPGCAMCYWGEALVLGPNINAPMFPAAVAPAAEAAATATKHAQRTTPAEQALIRAVARRYVATPPADRAPLDKAYADAMAEAAHAFPGNDTIQVLFAESLMDLSPWDYWEAAGTRPKNRTPEMLAALERVLARNPTHPGAAHYYIHAMEASSRPEKALPAARVLAGQIPGAGHVVHMPSHIYYRIGMYKEALQSNLDAIAVDEKYFSRSDSDPVYRGTYYPHNIHFVMVSALMGGDGKTALDAAAKLDKALSPELVREFGGLQPVKAAPYFSHVQFSSPDVLVALPDPGPDFVLVKAMWHYARAVGFARKGALADSQKEIEAIGAIERTANLKAISEWGVPAREIVSTARLVASGRLADARGDLPAAVKAYQEAVAVQDKLAYMEPPHWYYPVRQSLGAALLRSGQLDAAEQVLRASLARTPSNGWALHGLIEVYRKRGDAQALDAAQKRFDATWLGKQGGPALSLL
jgi:tetratricopeptide (TPR) repeat protein